MRAYTSHDVRHSPKLSKRAAHGEGARTVGAYSESRGGARQRFKRETREAVRYEPREARPHILTTSGGAFTCPRGCQCGGRCPRFD